MEQIGVPISALVPGMWKEGSGKGSQGRDSSTLFPDRLIARVKPCFSFHHACGLMAGLFVLASTTSLDKKN
jgi:hypothetical protein